MFDAINSIDRRYTSYRVQLSPAAGTSREAAAAAAAHFTLVRLYPDQAKDFDSLYQTSLAAVPDGEPKSHGIRLGEQVAAELLALRAKDGAEAPNTYRPYTTPGIYVSTVLPVGSNWGQVTPFALKESAQFYGRCYALRFILEKLAKFHCDTSGSTRGEWIEGR